MPSGDTTLSARVTPSERDLLAAAAEFAHTSPINFVRRNALEGAETDVLDRRIVTIPVKPLVELAPSSLTFVTLPAPRERDLRLITPRKDRANNQV